MTELRERKTRDSSIKQRRGRCHQCLSNNSALDAGPTQPGHKSVCDRRSAKHARDSASPSTSSSRNLSNDARIFCLTSKMSHGHSGRAACGETRLGPKLHFGRGDDSTQRDRCGRWLWRLVGRFSFHPCESTRAHRIAGSPSQLSLQTVEAPC